MLYPSLNPLVGETPVSFVSRMALLHRAPSARSFCLDMGMPFQGIVDGDDAALTVLARLTGQPVELLTGSAIRRMGTGFNLKGQELLRTSLRRARVMVCPRCLLEDLAHGSEAWMVGGRVTWLLDSIRSCGRHRVGLVQVAHTSTPATLHDFAANLAPTLPSIPQLAEQAPDAPLTGLETYLLGRLDGQSGPGWLDALPWHAAARTCEMIGAVAAFGPMAPIRSFGDKEWRQAGAAGFRIATDGKKGIRTFLEEMHRSNLGHRIDKTGPQAWFGRLHMWLTDTQNDPVYDPLRDIIIDFVQDTVPVGPEHQFFGRPVVEARRLHSIRTAALETGLHPKRLRRVLAATGVIPTDHKRLSDDSVVFDANRAAATLARAQRAISHREAETHLNAGRVHTQILRDHGFISPFAASGKEGLKYHAYDPVELDAFLASLLRDAAPIMAFEPPVYGIAEAARRANCGAAEIVRLILDRQLAWVGCKVGDRGYASVLVNADEIKRLVRGNHGDDLTFEAVRDHLRTADRVIHALVRDGFLPTRQAISPLNRCPYTAVPRQALAAFIAEYGSLHEIARERGLHFLVLKKRLDANGIEPALDRSRIPALFYRRQDISERL